MTSSAPPTQAQRSGTAAKVTAPTPWAATQADQMLAGKSLMPEVAEQAAQAALSNATPLSQNAYKVQLARVAVKRALLEAMKGRA